MSKAAQESNRLNEFWQETQQGQQSLGMGGCGRVFSKAVHRKICVRFFLGGGRRRRTHFPWQRAHPPFTQPCGEERETQVFPSLFACQVQPLAMPATGSQVAAVGERPFCV